MGKVSLPDITKFEDVLSLLLDPQKYIQYMNEFKAVHDIVKADLANLKTKEQADRYLSDSLDKLREADAQVLAASVQAEKILNDAKVVSQSQLAGANKSLHEANLYVENLIAEQAKFEKEKEAFAAFEGSVRDELDTRHAQYELDHVKLVKDQEEVLRQKERFEKIQAALAV